MVSVPDVQNDFEWHSDSDRSRVSHTAGFRSVLSVPMLRGENAVGAITVWHAEVGPFTDKHVTLLKTFADQAVIAIENVRLFRELEEALEQQTATSEILGVIASSPTDIQPVLDTVAKNAARSCVSEPTATITMQDRRWPASKGRGIWRDPGKPDRVPTSPWIAIM